MAKFYVDMQTPGKLNQNDYFTLRMTGQESNQIKLKVCSAGGKVLLERLREHLQRTTNDPNTAVRGTLAKSLVITEGRSSVFVGPKGKHHGTGVGRKTKAAGYHRPKTGMGVSHKRKHHGMTNAVSSQDVGYYLEYGTPRMSAEHWMETTIENCEDEVLDAMQNAWNEYVDSEG